MENTYTAKVIAFQGRFINIICQNDNTSCPLIDLCNSLLLLGEFCLSPAPTACTVPEQSLIKLLCAHYMTKAHVKGSKTKKSAMKTLKCLTLPIRCNMMLTSVEHMETSEELKLFEQLGIKVYHGNVVDPKDEELIRAIGTNTYETLLAGLAAYKANSSGSLPVDESATSHLGAVNWDLIDNFVTKNSTQLTEYGFQSLKQHIEDEHSTVCVLFWNYHFHVVLQLNGTLLLLQNNSDMLGKLVVWRHFNDVLDGSWAQQEARDVYVAKPVNFRGRRPFIIYPHMTTGSCALVALCNAILLRGDVELSKMFDCNSSLNLQHLHQVVFGGKKTVSYTMRPEEWIVAAGFLHQPLHVNMNFRNVYDIKVTKELEIFENFGFRLCHGFVADPEDLNLCNAIGQKYYDVTTKSPTSHLEDEDQRKLVDDFVKEYDAELTPYGLQSLKEKLCDTDLHVIFWNKQFHIAIKCNDRIFVLDPKTSSFDAGKIWRTLDSVDGAGATLASIRCTISGKSGEHKCIVPNCLLAFTSSFNLQRHNYVHLTSSASRDLDISEHRDEYSRCWDSLSSEEAGEILSLKGMKFKDNMLGQLIKRILEQRSSEGGKVAVTLSSITSPSGKGEKITSEVLFAILDEASEKTFLCSDIRKCKDERIWDGETKDIIANMNSLLACYSYLFEKAMVDKWLKHKAARAFKVGQDLVAEEKSVVDTKVNVQNIQEELHFSGHSPGDHSFNSTSRHDGPHLEGTGEVANENRVQDGPSLEHAEDDSIGNLHDLVLEFLRSFRNQAEKKFYRGAVEAMKYMDDLDMHIHFPHIEEYSRELAAYIIDHYDSDRAKSDISNAAAQYLIEQKLGKPEKEIIDEINVKIVDMPSPTSNMSFKKYARLNKLIRPFKLPKKFHRLFSFRWKGTLYIMTRAGRRAARGFMNFIIQMHRQKLSWRGEWTLSHMRLKDGLFLIDKEALYTADDHGMAEDFKKYIELLNPYFVIVKGSSSNSPPYWEILQTDTLEVPDPLNAPEALDSFHKYMCAHFAFMPPVSICQFLCLLFSICDGLRPNGEKQYPPLNYPQLDVGAGKIWIGWTLKVKGVFLLDDVFSYSRNGVIVNVYTNTHWHLLQYSRHFCSHILSLTKNIGGQDVQDMMLIHLMLACQLDIHLASLVRHVVNVTNMQGLFFRAWQALLASDDKTEEDDLLENLEESEDEESDVAVEETRIDDEDILQDLEAFKS